MAVTVSDSVGQGGANDPQDVRAIQAALNQISPTQGGPDPKLEVDGLVELKTIGAIQDFQQFYNLIVDGLVDPNGPTLAQLNQLITVSVILAVRSIGKMTHNAPLSREGHTGLAFNLKTNGFDDFWLVQGGLRDGLLAGSATQSPPEGWFPQFATAAGAIWDTGEAFTLPVTVLIEEMILSITSDQLNSIANELNDQQLVYRYETGPNSNTYVHWFLDAVGISIPQPPTDGVVIKGWNVQ